MPPPGYAMPPPGYSVPPPTFWMPPTPLKPSPGLRIVLLIALSMAMLITGLISLAGVINVASGSHSSGDIEFAAIVLALFAVSTLALVGVAIRAGWSRWAAIAAGIAVSLTCAGLVLGIPIIVTAARAPDLKRVA
jgi:hypothetical protein